MDGDVGLEQVDGKRLLVVLAPEGSDAWLIWGTAVVKQGKLYLNTPEADVLLPLGDSTQRVRSAAGLDFADGAEYFTLVRLGESEGPLGDQHVFTGLTLGDDED